SVSAAGKLLDQMHVSMARLYDRIGEGSKEVIAEAGDVARKMTQSVIENPDALVWMARVRQKSEHAWAHAMSSSIWGLVFARHLGLAPDVMQTLAQGLLLSQVGKTRLDDDLLNKQGYLSAEEYKRYQKFVEEGVAILSRTPGISAPVIKVVEYHRERHNGSGFPKGVTGDRIPLLGKIAGIVDHFQALIEPKPGVQPMSPSQAISQLYAKRNIEFQDDLVEKFIQAVGVYPAGTLVELSDGSVGVVVGQNTDRKLFPQVLRVLSPEKTPLRKQQLLDLRQLNSNGEIQLKVARTLPEGAYDIDLESCRLQSGGWGLRRWVS
ncbi:MAG: HD-GYP domain-containing protein, partial [Gammaproteobacteria bacterium]